MPLVDTHAHLDDGRFANDIEAVLDRAKTAGVERILTIGVDLATSRAAVAVAKRFPAMVRAVVGIQPNHVAEVGEGDWDAITALADDETVVGIGETGLDRYWDKAPIEMQEVWFRRHLAFCRERGLPVVIHCREADADVVRVLREAFDAFGSISGLMHSFAGDAATATACVGVGLHISFSGMVTFPKNDALREAAKVVPLDRLLVETDAPYLSPQAVRGKRNEPAFVAHTAAKLAEVVGVGAEELGEITTRNARALFARAW